ncbi:MAG TPA: hypothetical protein VKE91_04120, partial [Blastocatellia bacterium]|nr:hypothetical protein [Blastocatellia bacterium]
MFSERRHANRKSIQAVIEIGSKAPLSDSSLQVAISRGDHAHIQFSLFVRADGAYFALLKYAKQPYLRRKGRFAEKASETYAERFWIEEMFSDHKSRGLNLESTRLTDPDRIERLLVAVTL